MTELPPVHRHSDGSIDFDHYRNRATALRRQGLRDAATLKSAATGAMVMVAAIGFAIAVPSIGETARDQVASRSHPTLIR